jgi:hypothetical protein
MEIALSPISQVSTLRKSENPSRKTWERSHLISESKFQSFKDISNDASDVIIPYDTNHHPLKQRFPLGMA